MPILELKSAPPSVREFLVSASVEIETELDRRLVIDELLPENDPVRVLAEAMRYAVLGGGKRLRPALTLAAARAVDPAAEALAAAASVELLHAYTLVHDDLPAMDNDEMRRGKPTVHIAFDEAIAILTGDALLTASFACLSDLGPRCAPAVSALARAAGHARLLGGQALDLALTDENTPTMKEVERIHLGKTGALFGAAAELGAIAAIASADEIRSLREYGCALGVAFQHADDLDDGELASLSSKAALRRRELGIEAVGLAESVGGGVAILKDLARWVGGLEAS